MQPNLVHLLLLPCTRCLISAIISKKEARAFNQDSLSITPLINPSLMAFGTLDGVVNHDTGNIFSYIPLFGVTTSILGLCWLNKNPSKVCYFS